MSNITIRPLERGDLRFIEELLDPVDLFPASMLAPMAEPYLSESAPHHWLVAVMDRAIVGFAFAEPERMTEGTFNLLAIAVDAALQRTGIGQAIVHALEDRLRTIGGRVLLVETAGTGEFAGTRLFYIRQDFTEEARIRDFYSDGEDKAVFWKHL